MLDLGGSAQVPLAEKAIEPGGQDVMLVIGQLRPGDSVGTVKRRCKQSPGRQIPDAHGLVEAPGPKRLPVFRERQRRNALLMMEVTRQGALGLQIPNVHAAISAASG